MFNQRTLTDFIFLQDFYSSEIANYTILEKKLVPKMQSRKKERRWIGERMRERRKRKDLEKKRKRKRLFKVLQDFLRFFDDPSKKQLLKVLPLSIHLLFFLGSAPAFDKPCPGESAQADHHPYAGKRNVTSQEMNHV